MSDGNMTGKTVVITSATSGLGLVASGRLAELGARLVLVARNRAKRRLRAAAYALLPLSGRSAHDYVLVARGTAVARPFLALLSDITTALKAAHKKLDANAGEM